MQTSSPSNLDYSIVCQAEVDLPAWLKQLTGKSGWKLFAEEEAEMCDAYSFRRGEEEAEVILFHTGHATVEVAECTLYDGNLLAVQDCARLHYYNAESGEPITLN